MFYNLLIRKSKRKDLVDIETGLSTSNQAINSNQKQAQEQGIIYFFHILLD